MKIKRIIALLSALFMLALTVSCGSSGGSSSSSGGGTCESGVGTWAVIEISDERDCGGGGAVPSFYTIVVAQSGCDVTLTTPAGVFSGTMSGSTLTGTGSYPEDGGTTTATITATISGSSISGSSNWSWVGGSSCSGTSTFTGNKR